MARGLSPTFRQEPVRPGEEEIIRVTTSNAVVSRYEAPDGTKPEPTPVATRFTVATQLIDQMIRSEELPEFLTLSAYEELVKMGA